VYRGRLALDAAGVTPAGHQRYLCWVRAVGKNQRARRFNPILDAVSFLGRKHVAKCVRNRNLIVSQKQPSLDVAKAKNVIGVLPDRCYMHAGAFAFAKSFAVSPTNREMQPNCCQPISTPSKG